MRDLEVVFFDVSPDALEGLGAGNLRDTDNGLQCLGDGPGLGNAPGLPCPRRRSRLGGGRRSQNHRGRPSREEDAAGGQDGLAGGLGERRRGLDEGGEGSYREHRSHGRSSEWSLPTRDGR